MFSSRSAYDAYLDPYGIMDPYDIFDEPLNRGSFARAEVSQRAIVNEENAKKIFLDHLATVDVSKGPVTTEIIKFHLVPDMRRRFSRFVKDNGCTATSRKLTREEQDKVNKTRKSLMMYTSVKVNAEAQKLYLEKNPDAAKKAAEVASGSSKGPLTESKSKKRDANQAQLDPPAAYGSTKTKRPRNE